MRLKHFSLGIGSQIFKAFSDEARVRILFLLLQNKEMCISDLEQVLDFTQTKTSRHLTYLKNAGIVSFRKADRWIFYYIKDEVYDIVSRLLKFISKDITLQKDLEMYQVLYSNRELAINKIESRKWRA
ncbi:ArsR/SmtB family transcription factor [Xanthovirga aplysinae]|uniref:ArsR/SmtB family transcription factor n=1 Tax=Xanthovirga aplysinae TaxID=2529853 RepID=UPI0012BBEA5E|nr:metalloregulator ArsR/SmtB family transcription factor [Xanthovirga aplysinae]MTI29819.1 metalloregulator ArsR/SmtB family transcription factor [Xanthovirga aplysinae]